MSERITWTGLLQGELKWGTLLALSPDARQQMGERARACFAARFEIRRATEKLLAVIRANCSTS